MMLSRLSSESKILRDCYPKSKLLLSLAPEYKPASQELSRLTYTASNKPGKLNHLGEELEKRARKESLKAGFNLRSRASLLLTLYILKSLVTECRRDLTLFSKSVIKAVDLALDVQVAGQAGTRSEGRDLEILARAGSLFAAYTTFTDGASVDDALTSLYLVVLRKFAALATAGPSSPAGDAETRTRARLIGLAALSSAATSDALYSGGQYKRQTGIIIPALMACFYQTDIATLEEQVASRSESAGPLSPYFADPLAIRPPLEKRRALSIHAHVDGEMGPSYREVSTAAVRSFRALFRAASGVQVATLVAGPVVAYLDSLGSQGATWGDLEKWCAWLGVSVTSWTQLQYRYVVPSSLAELLVDLPDVSPPSAKLVTLVSMITAIFSSRLSLIGISTSDILSSLIALILRRAQVNPKDDLLPSLVECVAALGGKHVYYSDQVSDFAADLSDRITRVQSSTTDDAKDGVNSKNETLRILLACLGGVLNAAWGRQTEPPARLFKPDGLPLSPGVGDPPTPFTEFLMAPRASSDGANSALPRPLSSNSVERSLGKYDSANALRNRVAAESIQDTLPLLCRADYGVRSSYASILRHIVSQELESEQAVSTSVREMGDGIPARSTVFGHDGAVQRFLNALDATLYTLLLSPRLAQVQSSVQPSSSSNSSVYNSAAEAVNLSCGAARGGVHRQSRILAFLRSLQFPDRPGKVSVPQNEMETSNLSDFANASELLLASLERLPVQGTLAAVPMLLALDNAASNAASSLSNERAAACKELVRDVLASIYMRWTGESVNEVATPTAIIPRADLPRLDDLLGSWSFHPFSVNYISDAAGGSSLESFVVALASSSGLQAGAGLDRQELIVKLTRPWTIETALTDSQEPCPSSDFSSTAADNSGVRISNGLMHIDNRSLASLAQRGSIGPGRGVGVGELREALGSGRASTSQTNLGRSASVSTVGTRNAVGRTQSLHRVTVDPIMPGAGLGGGRTILGNGRRTLKRAPGEVSDIFQKLGIGAGSSIKSSAAGRKFKVTQTTAGLPGGQASPTSAPPTDSTSAQGTHAVKLLVESNVEPVDSKIVLGPAL